MIILQCTAKLLRELHLSPRDLPSEAPDGVLGSWYGKLLRMERRKCALFTNAQSLYSFFVPALRRGDFNRFPEVFWEALLANLKGEGFGKDILRRAEKECSEFVFTRTNSRSVLGSMNDLARMIEFHVPCDGGLVNVNVLELNCRLNRTPMSAIGYGRPTDAIRKAFAAPGLPLGTREARRR